MKHVNLADAQTRLGELVAQAEGGETIEIMRDGVVVAKLVPAAPRQPVDIARLRALTDRMPFQEEDAGTFIRRMRDEERY